MPDKDIYVGYDVTFSCFIKNPFQPFFFYLQNDLLPEGTYSGQNRHSYTISNVDRFHAGRYTCRAANGVGQEATAKIALQVLCMYLFDFKNTIFEYSNNG